VRRLAAGLLVPVSRGAGRFDPRYRISSPK
jgi:hypothetical protein